MARKKEVAKVVETTEEVKATEVVAEVKTAEATTKKTRVTKATKAAKKAVEEAAAAVEEMEAAVKEEVEEVPIEEAEPAKPEDLLKTPTKVAEQIAKMCNPDLSFEEETKEDRFHRIAPSRVSRVLDALRILNHCSTLDRYEYTEEEVDKMFAAIRKKVDSVENNFREKLDINQETDFSF